MANIFSFLTTIYLLSYLPSLCGAVGLVNNTTIETRSASTCADPTLAVPFVEAFLATPGVSAHAIQPRFVFVHLASVLGEQWQLQGDIFLAWDSPQEFTVPLYQLQNPTTDDNLYAISPDGVTPPEVSGFDIGPSIIGYVYSTQICGSVPLLAAFQPTVGDHWYTTSQAEHTSLLNLGWADAGVVAFVLPLTVLDKPTTDSALSLPI